jgi:hypothetical protein
MSLLTDLSRVTGYSIIHYCMSVFLLSHAEEGGQVYILISAAGLLLVTARSVSRGVVLQVLGTVPSTSMVVHAVAKCPQGTSIRALHLSRKHVHVSKSLFSCIDVVLDMPKKSPR